MAKEVGIRLTADAQQAVKSFDDTSKSMQGISRSAKSLTVDGADTAKILASIGERGGQAFKDLINTQQQEGRSLKEIQQAVQALAQEQSKAAKAGKQGYLEEAQAAAILKQREVERQQHVAQGLTELAGKMREWSGSLMTAGQEMATLQKQALLAFGDKGLADGAVKAVRTLDDEVGMAETSLMQAAVTLQKFGTYSDENLTRSAIAAKKTGQSIEEVSAAIGKFQKFGDSKSQKSLMKLLGISEQDISAAGGALEAIDAKFGTTTAGMVGNAALLKGEFGDAMQELGRTAVDASNSIAGAMLPAVQSLHGVMSTLSPETMEAAGAIIYATTAVTGVVGAIGTFQFALATLSEAQISSIATTGKWTIAIAAATAAIVLYIQTREAQAKVDKAAAEAGAERGQLQIEAFEAEARWAGKTADELAKLGVTREQLLRAEQGAKILGEEANSRSDVDKARQYYTQAEAWHAIAVAMGDTARNAEQARTAANTTLSDMQGAYQHYQAQVQLGFFKTKDDQRKALEQMVVQTLEASGKMGDTERKQAMTFVDTLNVAIQKLGENQEKASESTGKAVAKAASAQLKAAMDAMEIADSRDKLSHEERISRLRQMLSIANLSADERIEIEKRVAREQGAINEEASKADDQRRQERLKKEEQDRQARLSAEADLKAKLREVYGTTTQDRINDIEDQAKKYQQAGLNEVEIEKYRSGAIKKIRDEEAEAAKRAADEKARDQQKVNDGVQKEINLRDKLSERIKKTQFSGVGQSIQDAFKGGNFGFSTDTSLLGKMSIGGAASQPVYDQPKGDASATGTAGTPAPSGSTTAAPAASPAGAGASSAPILIGASTTASTSSASGATASVPTNVEMLVINANNVVLNSRGGGAGGGSSSGASASGPASPGAGMALDRDSYFSKGK